MSKISFSRNVAQLRKPSFTTQQIFALAFIFAFFCFVLNVHHFVRIGQFCESINEKYCTLEHKTKWKTFGQTRSEGCYSPHHNVIFCHFVSVGNITIHFKLIFHVIHIDEQRWTHIWLMQCLFVCFVVHICSMHPFWNVSMLLLPGWFQFSLLVFFSVRQSSNALNIDVYNILHSSSLRIVHMCATREKRIKTYSTRKHEWENPLNGQNEIKTKEKKKWELNQQVRSSTKVENLCCVQFTHGE